MFIARSLIFYPRYTDSNSQELSDEIIISSFHLNKLMQQFSNNDERLYLNMTNTNTKQQYLVTIGSSHMYDRNIIYAPQWILDHIGCTGICNTTLTLKKADISEMAIASKIIIKPLDPMAFEINTLECFEKAFMNLHSITENVTISIYVIELGYSILAHIEKVEPNITSLIINGEVEVEFINDFKDNNQETMTDIDSEAELKSEEIISNPIIVPIKDIGSEQRRIEIRNSWIKRFENNVISL